MILNFMKKIPAGIMVIPLLLGSLVNTLFPNVFEIGGLTAGITSNAGNKYTFGGTVVLSGYGTSSEGYA